jgi:hypothetical protein
LLRVTETGFHSIAVEWFNDARYPIEEAALVELARNPGLDPNRWTVIVDAVEDLDLKTVLSEHGATRAHIVGVEEQDFGFHSSLHDLTSLMRKDAAVNDGTSLVLYIAQSAAEFSRKVSVMRTACTRTPPRPAATA